MGYLGAKSGSGVYQAIINLMPPHDTYIEPFLGSGAIMNRKPISKKSIGLDLDSNALKQFNCSYPVNLLNTDALSWLSEYEPRDRTVIYCDPPYIHSTRSSNKRYQYELSDSDHELLLDILINIDCHIILSGYKNPLYDKKLSNWNSIDLQVMTRGGVRTEILWFNFDPEKIHYHTYAGKDFTDRQRIKRKAQRWANNFKKLPIYERQAILSAILAIDS